MNLTDEMIKKIKEELSTDPAKMGYAGKTKGEIVDLMNKPVVTTKTVTYTSPSRIHEVWIQVADTANVVTVKDIEEVTGL